MKKSVLMQPLLTNSKTATPVIYQVDPYSAAVGPIRSMQKFAVIALTTLGTDSIRPGFGTHLAEVPLMNMYNTTEVELFIRDEVKKATQQFFALQANDSNLTADDIINSIELKGVSVNAKNNIVIEIMFYPLQGDSIILSLKV